MDGCEDPGEIRCGDVCMQAFRGRCQCGGVTLRRRDDVRSTMCCSSSSCTKTGRYDVTCSEGIATPLEEGCPTSPQGETRTCNYYGNDTNRDYVSYDFGYISRSYFPCKDQSTTKCVPEAKMCQGDPLCSDGSDIDYCNSGRRTTCPTPLYQARCDNGGQCIPRQKFNDGVYDCDDLSDEKDYSEETQLDLDRLLTPCNAIRGFPGLYCGESSDGQGDCVLLSDWCIGNNIVCLDKTTNTRYTTDDQLICRNTTFWRQKDCGSGSPSPLSRCSGSWPGQCAYTRNFCDGETNTAEKTLRDVGTPGYNLNWMPEEVDIPYRLDIDRHYFYCKDGSDEALETCDTATG